MALSWTKKKKKISFLALSVRANRLRRKGREEENEKEGRRKKEEEKK